MVRLNRIVLQGFKSFNRKTSILLSPTFTIICGPNGTGKSNVLDGVCFVLGSISAKSLRADRLHELIFHGSKSKKPANYASVTLYFDNSDHVFPFDEPEVSISRRVNRRGICIYKIQGRTRTRQQVLELLAMAGLRPDGYNIIHQGEVTRIIEMSPVERRTIIDEISGILEYKEKKERAERDLQAVEQRLREAEIILNQRYDIFKRLEEEALAAERYLRLKNQVETLQASLAYRRVRELEERFNTLNFQRSQNEDLQKKLADELSEVEAELEQTEKKVEQIVDKLVKLPRQMRLRQKLTELKAQLSILRYKLKVNQREVKRLNTFIASFEKVPYAVQAVLRLDLHGIHGVLRDLIEVPDELCTAIQVAAGNHLNDVVVEDAEVATLCIEWLKKKKVGRVRFLPLKVLKVRPLKFEAKEGVVGVASQLVRYDAKHASAVQFVLGSTLIVKDLDVARALVGKARMVTLGGDVIEKSGAMVGGYLKSKEVDTYKKLKTRLEEENRLLRGKIEEVERKLKECADLKPPAEWTVLEKERMECHRKAEELRKRRLKLHAMKREVEERLKKLDIQCAKVEVELEGARREVERYGEIEYVDEPVSKLKRILEKARKGLEKLGLVNLRAPEQFAKVKREFVGYRERYEKVAKERDAVLRMIEEIEAKRREVFNRCLEEIDKHFKKVYHQMTGGTASLELEDPLNLESGLLIQASPAGKRLLNIDLMSGGEKTLTALAFLFALQRYKPAPFYVLDEVDAALDKENSRLVGELLQNLSKEAQFLLITHNDITIRYGDVVYGATMSDGETKLLGLEMP